LRHRVEPEALSGLPRARAHSLFAPDAPSRRSALGKRVLVERIADHCRFAPSLTKLGRAALDCDE